MPRQVNYKRMRPIAWTSGSGVGAVGCTGAMLTIAVSPPLPFFYYHCFYFTLFLPSPPPTVPPPSFSSPLFCIVPGSSSPPSPPCSMRHQVGSATLGCRAALRASSATACLRVRGPGPSLRTSTRPYIIWTGCSRVSLQNTGMKALDVFAGSSVIVIAASLIVSYFISLLDLITPDHTTYLFILSSPSLSPIRCSALPRCPGHPQQTGVFRSGAHCPQSQLAGAPL